MFAFTLLSLSIIVVLLINLRKKLNYWNERDVPNTRPLTPLGDLINCITHRQNLFDLISQYYRTYKRKGYKYFGFYFTTGPVLLIIDNELIKKILVNDFDHFNDHGMYCDREKLYLSDNMLGVDVKKWKLLREMINYVTTPTKVNSVLPIADFYSKKFIKIVDDKVNESLDIFDLSQRYSVDVSTNFFMGIDEESLTKNVPMMKYAHEISNLSWSSLIKVAFAYGTSKPANLFMGLLMNDDMKNFFYNYVTDAYKMRKEGNVKRKDAFGHFIDQYENDDKNFDFQSLVCQVFLIFAAAFDTTSFTTSYALYEIAKSKVYQERLRGEIVEVLRRNDDKINVEALSNMKFLDNFLTESLRYHPIIPLLYRNCTEDYKIPESDFVIEKGTSVIIPVIGIHQDEDYFKEADVFNPERVINKEYFMIFSRGPKRCPGKKMAYIMTKMIIIDILLNYDVSLDYKKTGDKLEKVTFTKQFLWTYKNKIWLKFKHIDKQP